MSANEYIVCFDDGRFLGWNNRPAVEYPDAQKFTSKRAAEQAGRKVNLESTVTSTADYAQGQPA